MASQASQSRAATIAWLIVAGIALSCVHRPPSIASPTTRVSLGLAGMDSAPGIGMGFTRPRLAVSPCPTVLVPVYIEAYPETKNANPAVPFNDTIRVAHIINKGPCETRMYHLLPYSKAEYQLVMYWDNSTPREQVLELRQISRSGGVGPWKKQGKAKGCMHTQATNSIADFWRCEYGDHPGATTFVRKAGFVDLTVVNSLLRILESALPLLSEDPAWFSCTSGCCTPTSASPF
jgi:hypothetical protein